MEKLLRRTRVAERVVGRRTKKIEYLEERDHARRRGRQVKEAMDDLRSNVWAARQARRDAWELGPLAPKLDLGTHEFGVVRSQSRRGDSLALSEKVVAERCRWAGTPEYLNLVPKDRVVVMEGPDKGKIDVVTAVHIDTGTVELKDLCKVNIKIPSFVPDADQRPIMAVPYRIPISAVRLVHPLKDPQTGAVRDVIVRQLARSRVLSDRQTGFRAWRRYIPGLNVTIPWPDRDVVERRDQAADTTRAELEARTFVPTLLRPPMPEQVLDELRNRFSRFRTRHEDWYIAKKEVEEAAKKAAKQVPDGMLMPAQEAARLRAAEKAARPPPELTDEMLENIGRIIAKNKAQALEAAGMTEVSSVTIPSELISREAENRETPSQ